MKLVNGKDAHDGVEYINGCSTEKITRDYYLEVPDMREGVYLFFIEVDWDESASKFIPDLTYCASAYGPDCVIFEEDVADQYDKADILKQALTDKCLSGKHPDV